MKLCTNKHNLEKIFGAIASKYDKINAILSLGFHYFWNHSLIHMLGKSDHLVDLCSGTGKVALKYLQTYPESSATLIDFSLEMLQIAKQRSSKHAKLTFLQHDVSQLPIENNSQSLAAMAYGLRNLSNPEEVLSEVMRILKPYGKLGILELTRPQNRGLIHGIHTLYLKALVPAIGKLYSKHPNAYQYLSESIQNLPKDTELEQVFTRTGFKLKKKKKLLMGTATIWLLEK
ncbi:bifunctional demethylmenaquinone methyltransferase/2-methoxy-6-polyprenyl-1,4-benzoquinol methylase UbiE [Chlamydia sp. 17-3921]|uniref:bifunctional demethylmenaquinone methyltransferase/2-methoxy-6-polyprenyl-1,4-benzoquinol methylase UbiE n=1 Tax=Chlamydia sp. 17-3921 TaxID=2675798 RepID=UPI00191910D6|nr:bifunctional demethylmenaquinone methyltransferase/2-methoxy-6-polyprenyl-1,4-benzoquinol methylase UbiE [Chlamydia sp. 17-3921]